MSANDHGRVKLHQENKKYPAEEISKNALKFRRVIASGFDTFPEQLIMLKKD